MWPSPIFRVSVNPGPGPLSEDGGLAGEGDGVAALGVGVTGVRIPGRPHRDRFLVVGGSLGGGWVWGGGDGSGDARAGRPRHADARRGGLNRHHYVLWSVDAAGIAPYNAHRLLCATCL